MSEELIDIISIDWEQVRPVCNGYLNPLIFNKTPEWIIDFLGGNPNYYRRMYCSSRDKKDLQMFKKINKGLEISEKEKLIRDYKETLAAKRWQSEEYIDIQRKAKTTAQLMALYGRLSSRAICEDIYDLKRSFQLMGQGNEFCPDLICREVGRYGFTAFLGENNSNKLDLFEYHIGYEGSSVLYISWLKHRDRFLFDEDRYAILNPIIFQAFMENLGRTMLADESWLSQEDDHSLEWRFWWD